MLPRKFDTMEFEKWSNSQGHNQQIDIQSNEEAKKQQVENAKLLSDGAQVRAQDAQRQYEVFMNQQINTDNIDFLETGGVPDYRLQKERDILWQNCRKTQEEADRALKTYRDLLAQYNDQVKNAEKYQYQQMNMGDLEVQTKEQKDIVEKKQTAAMESQNTYGLAMNAAWNQPYDFLEQTPNVDEASTKQRLLLDNAYATQRDLTQSRERLFLMEDTYNYRHDMQIISGMTDADRMALAMYGSKIDSVTFINALSQEERDQLRATGQYQRIIENPKAYLKQRGYGKEDLDRLAESYGRYLNEERRKGMQKKAEDFAKAHPVLATFSTYPMEFVGKVSGGLTALGSSVEHTLGRSHYHTMDMNSMGYAPSAYSNHVRETVSEDFNPSQKTIYNGVNYLMDETISNAVFGGLEWVTEVEDLGKTGERIYSTIGAFGDAVYDTGILGGNESDSMTSGILNAGLNWLTSGIDVEKLIEAKTWEKWNEITRKNAQGFEKMAQEDLNYLGNLVIQTSILAENSGFNQEVEELMCLGIGEEEAKRMIYKQYLYEVINNTIWGYAAGFGKKPKSDK